MVITYSKDCPVPKKPTLVIVAAGRYIRKTSQALALIVSAYARSDWSYYSLRDSLAWRPAADESYLSPDTIITGTRLYRKKVGNNTGFFNHQNLILDTLSSADTSSYYYIVRDAHPLVPRYYAVTAYDYGDYKTGTQSLETAKIANSVYVAPSGEVGEPVRVVPNPYRADADYRAMHGGVAWENRNDGTTEFFPQTDRRLYFFNLPELCLIRIYTVAGDLVDIVPHNVPGDDNQGWSDPNAEAWDLNSRNHQQVVSGLYLFTVEDYKYEPVTAIQDPKDPINYRDTGKFQTGKFAVIR